MSRRTSCLVAAGLLLLVSACASGEDTTQGTVEDGTPTATASAPSEPAPSATEETAEETEEADRAVEITTGVRDGKVSPKRRRVEVPVGSQVRLLVTSDVDDEVHVHGFEIEEPVEAGRTTTIEFVADQAGVFEVETHETGLELLQLEVR